MGSFDGNLTHELIERRHRTYTLPAQTTKDEGPTANVLDCTYAG